MALELTKPGIDLGIVIRDSERSLAFYRDVLGLEHIMDMPMPIAGGGTMHRMACGDSTLKLVALAETPPPGVPGGIGGASGIRYVTLSVADLDEVVADCEAAGVPIVVPITEIRPGVSIAMVEDPDGNWVEFLRNDAG